MRPFAFDLETHLFGEYQPGIAAPPIVCGSIASAPDVEPGRLLSKAEALAWLRATLERRVPLVGQNIAFDLGCALAAEPALTPLVFRHYEEDLVHDVGIRQALIDNAEGFLFRDRITGAKFADDEEGGGRYHLQYLVALHLGRDRTAEKYGPDAWRMRYARLEHLPLHEWPEAARAYPIADARDTWDVWRAQEGGANLHAEAHECRAAFALQLQRIWGLRANPDKVKALEATIHAELAEAKRELTEHGIFRGPGGPVGFGGTKGKAGTKDKGRLAELVTAAYNGDPPRAPKGGVSTDRDTLLESGDPVLAKLAGIGKREKHLSTYLPKLVEAARVPLCPEFNVFVATSRVSGDAQQWPKGGGIRECFEARPGTVFCSVDYGGLELRTVSQVAIWEVGFSRMSEELNKGIDVHCTVAAEFLAKTYDEVKANHKKDPVLKAFRDIAKIFNFGKAGGMGAFAMAYNARTKDGVRFCLTTGASTRCGSEGFVEGFVKGVKKRVCKTCVELAKKFGRDWLVAWPEQQARFDRAGQLTANDYTDVVIPVSNVVRAACGYTQALNTPFQGLGAVATKIAMWRVASEMYTVRDSPLWGSRLVLMMHDELISELTEAVFPEAADRKAYIMREALKQCCPDLAPAVEADPACARALYKEMSTERDESGRLRLWEPKKKAA